MATRPPANKTAQSRPVKWNILSDVRCGAAPSARASIARDIMLEHGDPKPVWITEVGYTVQSGPQPAVSSELQALYLRGAFERVRREWPWVEMLAVWNLSYGLPPQDEMSGYNLVEPDLTPRPAYWALRAMQK